MEPYEDLNHRLCSYETCMSEAELAEEEDQIAAALLATKPCDMPEPVCTCGHERRYHGIEMPYECYDCDCQAFTYPQKDPIYALMSRFTEDLFLLSAKMKAMGRHE